MARFRGVLSGQFYYNIVEKQTGEHIISAHEVDQKTGKPYADWIANLSWSKPDKQYENEYLPHEGEINWVNTSRHYQRQGIATKMLHLARNLSNASRSENPEKYGMSRNHPILYPQHSPNLSEEGESWARAVGGHIPDFRICEGCGAVRGEYENCEECNYPNFND